jgi:hypothetical protein
MILINRAGYVQEIFQRICAVNISKDMCRKYFKGYVQEIFPRMCAGNISKKFLNQLQVYSFVLMSGHNKFVLMSGHNKFAETDLMCVSFRG